MKPQIKIIYIFFAITILACTQKKTINFKETSIKNQKIKNGDDALKELKNGN